MADLSSLNMPSGRDPEDVFAGVEARGRVLRNRRYAILAGAATVLIVAIAVPVASALSAPSGGQRINAATQPDERTTTTTAQPADDTTTTTAATPTTAPASTSTTARNATATTAPATTTTAPRYEPCPLDAIDAAVSTDRQTYPVGTPVVATGTLRNASDRPCYLPSIGSAVVHKSNGELVMLMDWPANDTDPNYHPTATPPGSARTYNWTWDQRGCSYTAPGGQCRQVGPGDYAIELGWRSGDRWKKARSALFVIG